MALTDNALTVNEAVEFLRLQGMEMNAGLLRMLLFSGMIPSQRCFRSRIIARNDLTKYARRKLAEK